MKRVIIIGGGVAGLGAAYKIRRAADAGNDVEFVLVEKDARLGGKLATDHVADPERGGRFVVDGGSDSFLTDKPAVHRVAKLLGIFDDETPTLDENKKTFIVKDGKLVEMPDGIMMFAPTKIMPMATTKLYSWPAKFRMALDLVIPKKKLAPGEFNDESLESFVVRRMGRESLDRLAEPLVGGVNGSDPKDMSLAATYPMLLDMEQQHGSLVRGFLAQRKKVEEMKAKYPPKPGAKRRTFFSSFLEGLQFLTDKMADAAGREHITTGAKATSITREPDGSWTRRAGLRRSAHRRRRDRRLGGVGDRAAAGWRRCGALRTSWRRSPAPPRRPSSWASTRPTARSTSTGTASCRRPSSTSPSPASR